MHSIIARNSLSHMLVDDGSFVNILFGCTFSQIQVNHPYVPVVESLYDVTGDALSPSGQIMLWIVSLHTIGSLEVPH